MIDRIDALTTEQAMRAVEILYGLLPQELWETNEAPSLVRLESVAQRISDEAPDEIRTLVETLLSEDDRELKGECAKLVLSKLAQQEALRPYIEEALERATTPHKSLPVGGVIGLIVICLISCEFKYEKKGGKKFRIIYKSRASESLKAIADLMRELSENALEKLGNIAGIIRKLKTSSTEAKPSSNA